MRAITRKAAFLGALVPRSRAPLALVAALLLGPLSCGDGTTEPAPPTPSAPLPTTVTVSPETVGLAALGATTQLSAQVFDQNGGVMTGQTVAWSSSSDAVATVAGSGLVTSVGNGTATITATAGAASGTATVTVAQEAFSPIELALDPASLGEGARLLSPDSLVIFSPGASARLLPVGTDANGNALEAGAAVAWSSSDAAVATVDSTGLVTAVAVGAAMVTATSGTSAAADGGNGRTRAVAAADGSFARTTATMIVLVSGVKVTPPADTLTALGDTVRLAVEGLDTNGNAVTEFTWSSDDDSVATVDMSSGLVTAVANGAATITATGGGFSAAAQVTVSQAVAAVAVTPSTDTLTALGDTVRLKATALDANGHGVEDAEFAWSSGNDSVAPVDTVGLATAKANGTATITATADSVSGTAEVTVSQEVDAVEVTPPTPTLAALGATVRLKAAALDANGHGVADAEFAWSSDDLSVATVDPSGLVTAAGIGAATITATAGALSGTAQVTVSQEVVTVEVSPPTSTLAALDDTVRLAATALDANGHEVVDAEFAWFSDDHSVATVNRSGLVTAVGNGTATITATADSLSGTAEVTVSQEVAAVDVTPSTATLAVGNTVTLEAAALDANGHEVADADFAWSSDDHSVATVNMSGLVTAVGNGIATVTATADSASGSALVRVGVDHNFDRVALSALYSATNGASWTRSTNWLTDAPLSEWFGVQVDNVGRVSEVSLFNNNLSGILPPELGELSQLVRLDLENNQLTGDIPGVFYRLSNLEFLNLGGNQLTGPITEPLQNSPLVHLDLGGNQLTGSIPLELARLSNLTWLDLSDNYLSGEVPTTLMRLQLSEFHFDVNDGLCLPPTDHFMEWMNEVSERSIEYGHGGPFCGEIEALRAFYYSTGLDLVQENSEGGIGWFDGTDRPYDRYRAEWAGVGVNNRGWVDYIHLPGFGLTGEIPPELGDLFPLERLYLDASHLGTNQLTGSIPPELGQLSNLRVLRLSSNPLKGPIPPELGGLSQLEVLLLVGNQLTGPIPPELGELSNLRNLNLAANQLTGPLPPELGQLSQLEQLRLGRNYLSDQFPVELMELQQLQHFEYGVNDGLCLPPTDSFMEWMREVLERNVHGTGSQYGGPLCGEVEALRTLYETTGGPNWKLNTGWSPGTERPFDSYPPRQGVSTNDMGWVTSLYLVDNGLTGAIPAELGQLSQLERLDLDGNQLTGPIPPELGQLSQLERLDLEFNQLTGSIPPELGQLSRVTGGYLTHNRLSGCIPPLEPRRVWRVNPQFVWATESQQWVTHVLPYC